ncbi:NfeD family protein [Desulfosporosinus sp. PR]|uniref:NfeD family protein n=1 Tax=Candidatus Desulfosporosinus nitrosoreducens TaxID=3401928 RepID=UPI0027F0530C|nr:NfeD family protein [Desulfosporosinus sp. PR]MDQ7092381.1 NfeD family protein [Desulfosporosinus sp. PR]
MGTGFVVILFILGIVLLFLELFVPGGILGFLGIVALVIGIMLSVNSLLQGLFYVCLLLIILALLIALSFRFSKTRRFWEKFALKTRQTKNEGYVAPKPSYENFLGKQGIALSQLRPAGTADFNGERLDVVTEGGFIANGSKISVVAVEGTRIVVRQISE